ncbi:hypothetical protein ACJJTC_011925 [Scirpophaga incertulas]
MLGGFAMRIYWFSGASDGRSVDKKNPCPSKNKLRVADSRGSVDILRVISISKPVVMQSMAFDMENDPEFTSDLIMRWRIELQMSYDIGTNHVRETNERSSQQKEEAPKEGVNMQKNSDNKNDGIVWEDDAWGGKLRLDKFWQRGVAAGGDEGKARVEAEVDLYNLRSGLFLLMMPQTFPIFLRMVGLAAIFCQSRLNVKLPLA